MLSVQDKILKITRSLYPDGRAFKMPVDGDLEKLHKAIAITQEQAYSDATSILNSILPDNNGFTADDATDWERRLGMITNTSVSLSDRKLAILRKLYAPGQNPAKGHYLYLQDQLQRAGFDVYVYENIFPDYPSGYTTQTPSEVSGSSSIISSIQYGDYQYGDVQYGGVYNNIIANSIYQSVDMSFNIGSSFRSTFFIGGNILGSFANVDANREIEFRQLILRVKHAHLIGYLFINYI